MAPVVSPGITIHRKLGIAFTLSSALLVVVGAVGYFRSSADVILITSALAVSAVMVTGFFIYRSITKPIDCMKSSVKEIAKGNFNVRIREDGRRDELGELARSITQMKDELKEKDRLKDEFINIASHELRTPIQPIVSYVELARRGVIDKDQSFEVVMGQARRLKRLADDILDVSRIEGKRLVLNKEHFAIGDVISAIIDEKRPSLSKDVIINAGDQKSKPIQVYADKSRIIQVLSNIVGNAVKFTKKGSIHIATELIDGGSAVEISISDTGGGIPDEIFPTLFSKFATKSVAKGTEHGTGLGLFICKGIVEAHGGTIAGLNNDQGGATFKMILPIDRSEDRETEQAEADVQTPRQAMDLIPQNHSPLNH